MVAAMHIAISMSTAPSTKGAPTSSDTQHCRLQQVLEKVVHGRLLLPAIVHNHAIQCSTCKDRHKALSVAGRSVGVVNARESGAGS